MSTSTAFMADPPVAGRKLLETYKRKPNTTYQAWDQAGARNDWQCLEGTKVVTCQGVPP